MATDASDTAVESHMIACVQDSLSLYLMSNARFMCERLVAEFPSEVCHSSWLSCISKWSVSLNVTLHEVLITMQLLTEPSCALLGSEWVVCHPTDKDNAAGKQVPVGDLLLQIRSGTPSIPLTARYTAQHMQHAFESNSSLSAS